MKRPIQMSLALSAVALAALAAPALAQAPDAAAAAQQFMAVDVETAGPLEAGVETATEGRASDLSLVSLKYRPRRDRPAIRIGEEGTRLESIRYRPRRSSPSRAASYGGSTMIHAGFFDPDGDPERGLLFGFRMGPKVDEHLQLGVGLDWRHRTQRYTELIGTGTGPGGEQIDIRRELSSSTSDWVPLQMFAELNAGSDMTVIPYFGIAGGYQWLGISGDVYNVPGDSFDATFGGWGWQGWGGIAYPIGPRSRLNAEVFVNGSELHRDTVDALSGQDVRESVSMDGVGMRFGLSWGFF